MSRVQQPAPSKQHPDRKAGSVGAEAGLAGFLAGYLPPVMARWRQPGLAVAVEQAGAAPWAAGFGVCRLGEERRVDADTMFALVSCSKPFAAMSVALLVDDGLLALDDRVVELLPWFALSDPAVIRQVTVRDLLCWLRFLLQGGVWEGRRLVSESVFRQLWTPHTAETGELADHELSRVVGRGDALVLTVGALNFDLERTGSGGYLAHKRWPYACAPQFSARPETDGNGRYTGFSTSQDARFSFLGSDGCRS